MLVKLKSIAKIKSGYSFRGSLDLNSSGNVFILQAKNILSDVEVDDDFSLEQINLNFKNENIFLQKKDIVFLSKTGPQADFRSAVFNSNKKQVIFSNTILSIRIENSNIIPEYLSIYLNSNECKKDLQKISIGSITKHIPPNLLGELEIPIPPLIVQENLIKLKNNILNQEKIYRKKMKLKQEIINQTLTNTINKNK